MTDTQLIRQWWYTYCRLLRGEQHVLQELWALTDECESRGVCGKPMSRAGAGDLASEADLLRGIKR